MSATIDETTATIDETPAMVDETPAMVGETPAIVGETNGLNVTADEGDVPDGLGIGFSSAALDMAADDEELVDLEMSGNGAVVNGDRPVDDAVDQDELPDEVGANATALSADDGDQGMDAMGLGFDQDQLQLAEEDDELDAIERHESAENDGASTMPDERDEDTTDEPEADATETALVDGGDEPGADATETALVDGKTSVGVVEDSVGLVTQATAAPTRKVKAAGLGGVLGAIPAPILTLLDLLPVSDAVLGAITAALTLLGSLSGAYLTRERSA